MTVTYLVTPPQQRNSTHFPYTTLFRSGRRGAGRAARRPGRDPRGTGQDRVGTAGVRGDPPGRPARAQGRPVAAHLRRPRSEEHTSELQSPCNLVCRLLLEKKKPDS